MLTKRHLSTIRAALLFWKEEITVHDPQIALPYLGDESILPLESEEIEQLRRRFENVRYVAYDPQTDSLLSQEFLPTGWEQNIFLQGVAIATVVLPR